MSLPALSTPLDRLRAAQLSAPERTAEVRSDSKASLRERLLHAFWKNAYEPAVAILPRPWVDPLSRLLALAMAPLYALVRRSRVRAQLAYARRPSSVAGYLSFSRRHVLARLRWGRLYVYKRSRPERVEIGNVPAGFEKGGVIATVHSFAIEILTQWAVSRGGVGIRYLPGQGGNPGSAELSVSACTWPAPGDVFDFGEGMVNVGPDLRRGLAKLRDGRFAILTQDSYHDADGAPQCLFTAPSEEWPVGGPRLATMGRCPLYFGVANYRGGWKVDVIGPIEMTEAAVRAQVKAYLRERPWDWIPQAGWNWGKPEGIASR